MNEIVKPHLASLKISISVSVISMLPTSFGVEDGAGQVEQLLLGIAAALCCHKRLLKLIT